MSAPAANTFSPPHRTTAPTSSRSEASCDRLDQVLVRSSLIAFIGGRSSRIVADPVGHLELHEFAHRRSPFLVGNSRPLGPANRRCSDGWAPGPRSARRAPASAFRAQIERARPSRSGVSGTPNSAAASGPSARESVERISSMAGDIGRPASRASRPAAARPKVDDAAGAPGQEADELVGGDGVRPLQPERPGHGAGPVVGCRQAAAASSAKTGAIRWDPVPGTGPPGPGRRPASRRAIGSPARRRARFERSPPPASRRRRSPPRPGPWPAGRGSTSRMRRPDTRAARTGGRARPPPRAPTRAVAWLPRVRRVVGQVEAARQVDHGVGVVEHRRERLDVLEIGHRNLGNDRARVRPGRRPTHQGAHLSGRPASRRSRARPTRPARPVTTTGIGRSAKGDRAGGANRSPGCAPFLEGSWSSRSCLLARRAGRRPGRGRRAPT